MASELRVNTLKDASGNNSVATSTVAQGSAKAWINFNGTGTPAVRDSFNCTIHTDVGTGTYLLSYTSSLANANYSISGAGSKDVGESTSKFLVYDADDTFSTGQTQIRVIQRTDDGESDQTHVFMQTHGDLA